MTLTKPADFHPRYSLKSRRQLLMLRTAILFELIICAASFATCQITGPPPPDIAQVVVVNRQIPMALSEGQGVRFRPLSTGDGIWQAAAAAGVQDDLGFLWFATPFG